MKRFEFDLVLTVDASSKEEAKEIAKNVMENLREMMGHSPHSCQLELIEHSGLEIDFDEEDYED